MEPTRTRCVSCPVCGKPLDSISSVQGDNQPPQPGDITVCLYCGAVMEVGGGLVPQPFTPEEAEELCRDPELMAQLQRVEAARRLTLHLVERRN